MDGASYVITWSDLCGATEQYRAESVFPTFDLDVFGRFASYPFEVGRILQFADELIDPSLAIEIPFEACDVLGEPEIGCPFGLPAGRSNT